MPTAPSLNISQEELTAYWRRNQIRELAVFGSILRADFDSASDIDILVDFEPDAPIGFLALARIRRELAALFGRNVDLVPKRGLKPAIRAEVLAGARTLYARRTPSPRRRGVGGEVNGEPRVRRSR